MSVYKIGKDIPIERTVRLNPSQYEVTAREQGTNRIEGARLSQQAQEVLRGNGADDVVWTDGQDVYVSSGSWNQLRGALPESGDVLSGKEHSGKVLHFDMAINSMEEAKDFTDPPRFNAKSLNPLKGFYVTVVGATVAHRVAREVGQALAEKAPAVAQKLGRSLPGAVGLAAGVGAMAVTGAVYQYVTGRMNAEANARREKNLAPYVMTPNYELAHSLGQAVKP